MSERPGLVPAAKSKASPAYISSSGQTLTSLPRTTRLNNLTSTVYNFLGLYVVSLLSLDPYTAAQNSQFNTRGPGRNTGRAPPRSNAGSNSSSGGRPGGGISSSGPRIATVNDVRGT